MIVHLKLHFITHGEKMRHYYLCYVKWVVFFNLFCPPKRELSTQFRVQSRHFTAFFIPCIFHASKWERQTGNGHTWYPSTNNASLTLVFRHNYDVFSLNQGPLKLWAENTPILIFRIVIMVWAYVHSWVVGVDHIHKNLWVYLKLVV